MTTEPTSTKVAIQPAMIPADLPQFEGVKPVGVVTKVNGAGSRIHRAMHLDEKVVLVIEARVSNVGHGTTDDGVKRIHTLRVSDLYELEGKAGATLLRSLRQAYNLADDQRHGRTRLGMAELEQPETNAAGIAVVVDDEGRVHTATADEGGEALGLPHVDVAVLVFEDESRALWPDDFADAAGPHPEAGERIRKPGAKAKDEPVLIRRVLDADTGETLEEWTDEQEDERLRELERELEEQEREQARADREATEELLAARGESLEPSLPGEDAVESSDPHEIAEALLTTPEGAARSIGSVTKDLVGISDLAIVEAALELEQAGRNRSGMVQALESRANDLRAIAMRVD